MIVDLAPKWAPANKYYSINIPVAEIVDIWPESVYYLEASTRYQSVTAAHFYVAGRHIEHDLARVDDVQ